ncbi:MAG: hypothetical protein ACLUVG_04595 [Phocaeicola vulgatus]
MDEYDHFTNAISPMPKACTDTLKRHTKRVTCAHSSIKVKAGTDSCIKRCFITGVSP